jgi:hypothetical protein
VISLQEFVEFPVSFLSWVSSLIVVGRDNNLSDSIF